MLRLIGVAARRDRTYAGIVTGILAGVLPAHSSLSASFILETLLHSPGTYASILGAPALSPPDLQT
ncbi:MAG TPA: hypothetical protein VEW94_10715 [Chloroflexia bacterium]|nr:hypothetical protein [Chloroflexia bacterium]